MNCVVIEQCGKSTIDGVKYHTIAFKYCSWVNIRDLWTKPVGPEPIPRTRDQRIKTNRSQTEPDQGQEEFSNLKLKLEGPWTPVDDQEEVFFLLHHLGPRISDQ